MNCPTCKKNDYTYLITPQPVVSKWGCGRCRVEWCVYPMDEITLLRREVMDLKYYLKIFLHAWKHDCGISGDTESGAEKLVNK